MPIFRIPREHCGRLFYMSHEVDTAFTQVQYNKRSLKFAVPLTLRVRRPVLSS